MYLYTVHVCLLVLSLSLIIIEPGVTAISVGVIGIVEVGVDVVVCGDNPLKQKNNY